jgi:DNA-binding NarL/FixJ family response regulator
MSGGRVLVADDQRVVRFGLRLILEKLGFEVVGEAETGRQAVEMAAQLRPDVCLLDIRMPDLDGLAACRRIAGPESDHPIPVVMLTTFDHTEYLDEAIDNGASGFLLKDAGPPLIAEAIDAALRGDALIDPSMVVRLLRRRQEAPSDVSATEIAKLSARELDVVAAVARGLTNDEIKNSLFISLSTVKSHLTSVQQKLQLRNRVEIAAWAWRYGVVTD